MSLHQDPNYRAYISKYGEAGRDYLPSRYLDPNYRSYVKKYGENGRDYVPNMYLDHSNVKKNNFDQSNNIISNVIKR